MVGVEEGDVRAKRRGETDLQWRLRISQYDLDTQAADGPLVTPEAETHGDYRLQNTMVTRASRASSPS